MEFLLPTWLIPSGRDGPSQEPETLAPVPFPSPPRAHGIGPGSEQMGARRDGGAGGGRQKGGAWEEPRENWVEGREGDDGGRNPSGAGRGGPASPGQAAAERTGPALQESSGSPGRSHLAAGAGGGSRTAHRARYPGQRPGRTDTAPCSSIDSAAGPSSGGPAAQQPVPATPPPSACSLAGPAPGWGRGSTTKSGDGPPTGHRAAPRGLTDPEDRQRWVWARQSHALGAPG